MRDDKVTFFEAIIFLGGLYWVFTTNSSETFWTISISLSLVFIAKSYLIYRGKKDKATKNIDDSSKESDDKHRWEGDIEGEGLWKVYLQLPNGNEALEWEINYKNGIKEGLRKRYWLNGVLRSVVNFKNDKEEGVRKDYNGDGVLFAEANYKNGIQNGFYKENDLNGNLHKEGQIVNGELDGEWKTYFSNGKLESVSMWKNGEKIDFKFSNKNEELVSKSEYSIVYLFDKDGNEYRYSINESDIPEEIKDEDDVEINIALNYHNLLGRPIIPEDPEVEGDDDNSYSFKYYTDGLELTDKQLESEEAEMIHKAFIISSLVKTDKKVKLEKTRRVLIHQIEDGLFLEDFGDGIYNETQVKGQRHILVREYQSTEQGKDDWSEYESETEDEFYLTGKDEGYRYDEGDLVKFFKIKNWEWTFNATNAEEDWSVEDDPDNILIGSLKIRNIKEKWNTYKNKFPKISSKSQFDFKIKKG
jgi:antitoxin component YwqK of YwqJK toxin-antitoxin module